MAIINKATTNEWKTLWNFLRKLKMELPFELAILLLGLYPKNPSNTTSKESMHHNIHSTQFTVVKCWNKPKYPSVNEWIKKLWYIYMMEYYIPERKKERRSFATAWMKLESVMLSEISQVVKDKYHMISPVSEI